MARVHLVIPDDDRARFGLQAHREGLSLSAWLCAAARERLDRQARAERFTSRDDLTEFFSECDVLPGPRTEPDWEQHLVIIDRSRRGATTKT